MTPQIISVSIRKASVKIERSEPGGLGACPHERKEVYDRVLCSKEGRKEGKEEGRRWYLRYLRYNTTRYELAT